jgi:hypothetical protein
MLLPWIVVVLVLLAAVIGFTRYVKRRAKGETPRPTADDQRRGTESAGRV